MKKIAKDRMEEELIGKLSEPFLQAIKEAVDTIPTGVSKLLAKQGWKIRLVRHIGESDPETAALPARGHDNARSFNYLFGFADLNNGKVVVAEWADTEPQYLKDHPPERKNPFAAEVFKHELAHCFDHALKGFSATKRFVQVCSKEAASVPPEKHRLLAYYLQSDDHGHSHAGREEVFAELFAIICGGGPDKGEIDNELSLCFPRTNALIKAKIDRSGKL